MALRSAFESFKRLDLRRAGVFQEFARVTAPKLASGYIPKRRLLAAAVRTLRWHHGQVTAIWNSQMLLTQSRPPGV